MRELRALGIDPPRWNPTSHRSFFVRGGRPRRLPGGSAALARWLAGAARRRPAELAGLSAAEWLRRELPSARARESAAALVRVTTFVADQESLSADVAAAQVATGLWPGVRYLRGGWGSLVEALAGQAVAAGATLRTGAAVRALQRRGDGWRASLDDEMLDADVVVVAAGVPGAFAKLLGERSPVPPGPAAEVSALDLGLDRLPRPGRTFALGIDAPTYLSKHSPPDHRDGVLLSLASYARAPRPELEAVADAVQPGWRERARLQRFLPRMVAVSAVGEPGAGRARRPPGGRPRRGPLRCRRLARAGGLAGRRGARQRRRAAAARGPATPGWRRRRRPKVVRWAPRRPPTRSPRAGHGCWGSPTACWAS